MFATWGPRVLAPIFLVVCVIAVLSIVNANEGAGAPERGGQTGQGGDRGSNGGEGAQQNGGGGGEEEGSGEETYTVESGDVFSTIAADAGISTGKLERLNPDADPNSLQPGQVLQIR